MSEAPTVQPVDITDLRRRLGAPGKPISQPELARRCGVNQSTISRCENDPSMQRGAVLVLLQKIDAETPARDDPPAPREASAA